MPAEFTTEDLDQITSIIYAVVSSPDLHKDMKARAFQTVLALVRSDKRFFDYFRPSPEVIENLRLPEFVMDKHGNLSSLAASIVVFLMRYNQDIDYVTFSQDAGFVRTMRRFESMAYA